MQLLTVWHSWEEDNQSDSQTVQYSQYSKVTLSFC